MAMRPYWLGDSSNKKIPLRKTEAGFEFYQE